MSSHPIQVFSEIGKLKKVMLHRPGKELENLLPDYLERLLFDDIPFLEDAQKEHDAFAQALRDEGIEVLYLEQLAAESLTSPEIRDQFIEEYLDEANIRGRQTKAAIRELLHGIKDNQELVEKTMAGVQKVELPEIPEEAKGLTDLVESDYPFAIDPMPNLYFTRDPFATIGNAVSLNHITQYTVEMLNLYITVKKIHVSKVGMNWFFQKMCWRLVFHNVQTQLLSKNSWSISSRKMLASRKFWLLNLPTTVSSCTWILSSLWLTMTSSRFTQKSKAIFAFTL